MDSSLKQRLNSMSSSDISLQEIASNLRKMKSEGIDREIIQAVLEHLRGEATTATQDDRLLEIMDIVAGFCNPVLRVWE